MSTTTTTKRTRVVAKDNGYFEIVTRPGCGHESRVTTEHVQYGIDASKRKANRERHFSSTTCGVCARA